jgi:hypothetical protein
MSTGVVVLVVVLWWRARLKLFVTKFELRQQT